MSKKIENNGFSPENEVRFLKGLDSSIASPRVNLEQEVTTQIAEDFGIIEFTLEYKFNENGEIVDIKSGQKIVEITERGGVDEETESIKKIEKGLRENLNSTWIHFSPANEKLGYPSNCVDFWRRTENNEVVWTRMLVENDFEKMNEIRTFLSGEEKMIDEMEILKSPIKSELKLCEIFGLFQLSEQKNNCTLELIESVVNKYVDEFEEKFGEKLTDDSDTIFRLYSACYMAVKKGEYSGEIISRDELILYMFGEMNRKVEIKSFGCSVTTEIGEFGEKIGYYVDSNGQVKFGEIPEDYKECIECGCWYQGETCPFCH